MDGLLSEHLRSASPSDLTRARLMAGATLFLLLFDLLYVADVLRASGLHGPGVATGLSTALLYVGLLMVMRRAVTLRVPALLLCTLLTVGLVGSVFALGNNPYSGTHASVMLLPAVAVYLLGPRGALPITLLLIASLGFVYPFHVLRIGGGIERVAEFWGNYFFASIAFLGAWGLGTLHSAARHEAQASLERTLKEKRESEGKLLSLIESTDDLVCSLDLSGRLITANSALRRLFSNLGKELPIGEFFFAMAPPEQQELWRRRLAQVASGQRLRIEDEYLVGDKRFILETSLNPIHGEGEQIVGATIFSRDITLRKEAEARLGEMHRTLVDVSRQAGMAEIATGVLHNVGNILNSVNISTALLAEQLRRSRIAGLARAIQLLRERGPEVGTFLASDPQGRKLPGYLIAVTERLLEERVAMTREVLSLSESVDHLKTIITTQQQHARTVGTVEELHVPQLIDEALKLDAASLEHLGITVVREYGAVPPLLADRHKLLQILVNLLSNARHALVESPRQDKQLIIRIRLSAEGKHLLIDVADNGMGIAPEHLARIFSQGFTTKKTGHGFGLHISALAATEMRGRLTCASPGPGQGASFTLELPLAGEEVRS